MIADNRVDKPAEQSVERVDRPNCGEFDEVFVVERGLLFVLELGQGTGEGVDLAGAR